MVRISLQNSGGKVIFLGHQRERNNLGHLKFLSDWHTHNNKPIPYIKVKIALSVISRIIKPTV